MRDILYFWPSLNHIFMYTYDYLFDFTRNVFKKMGCSDHDAHITAKVFLAAELRGLASHGMIRIKDYYQLWKANRINIKPNIRIIHETPSTAVVDGDGAIGMVAAELLPYLSIVTFKKRKNAERDGFQHEVRTILVLPVTML